MNYKQTLNEIASCENTYLKSSGPIAQFEKDRAAAANDKDATNWYPHSISQ